MAFPTLDYNIVDKNDVPSSLGFMAVQNVNKTHAITTAMLASGIVTALFRMPAYTRYISLYANASDMDTGSPALALDLGIAGVSDTTYDDVDCFLDGSTIGQAGTGGEQVILKAGAGLIIPVEHWVTLTAATAAATAAAGTLQLGMQCVLGEQS
jgi:hypothetical protein